MSTWEIYQFVWACLQELAKVAPGLTFLVAVLAFSVAWRQLKVNLRNQQETIAKTLYREFLKMAIERPELSTPNWRECNFQNGTIDGQTDLFQKYERFVAYMLHACEELLDTHQAELWKPAMRGEIGRHRNYLCDHLGVNGLRGFYSEKLIKFVEDDVCGPSASVPRTPPSALLDSV